MGDEFDVIVVGAGPAGSAAALARPAGRSRVLLLDRADFPRDKPCGDGIAAHALDVLAELGVTDAVDGYAPLPALRLVGPGGGAVARALPRPAYTVPRRVFDARLVAAAVAAGAELRRHTVRRVELRGRPGGARRGVVRPRGGGRGRRRFGGPPGARPPGEPGPPPGAGHPGLRPGAARPARAAHRHLGAALAGVRLVLPDR